ncbi:MAG: hypothetical protein WC548_03190 [Candidatus Pacearchaeota archaeon]
MSSNFQVLDYVSHEDGRKTIFGEEDSVYTLETFSPKGELLDRHITPVFSNARYLTSIEEKQVSHSVKRIALDLAPAALMIGGVASWGYLANNNQASAGLLPLFVGALSGIGLHVCCKELSNETEEFNLQLRSFGFNSLRLAK